MIIGQDISVSLAGVFPRHTGVAPREALDWAQRLGVRGVALDSSLPGFRARELGRSARRDLAASMRRRELEHVGLDLWIPAEHFTNPEHCQRAIDSVIDAAELSNELAKLVGGRSRGHVSIMTPESMDPALHAAMGEGAAMQGGVVIDHRIKLVEERLDGLAVGIDPASVIIDGGDPASLVHRAGARIGSVRLDDVNAMGRCPVGAEGGRLDLDAYKGSLIVQDLDWITIDLRQIPDPRMGFIQARDGWESGLKLPIDG